MRLSYNTVASFLNNFGDTLTPDQLYALQDIVTRKIQAAEKDRQKYAQALALAQDAARAAGLGSVEELLRMASRSDGRPAERPRTAVRKPYLALDGSAIFAVHKDRPVPPELERYMQQPDRPWSLSEFHYKNLAAAAKARGITLPFDPVQRHAELVAAEPVRYQRPGKPA